MQHCQDEVYVIVHNLAYHTELGVPPRTRWLHKKQLCMHADPHKDIVEREEEDERQVSCSIVVLERTDALCVLVRVSRLRFRAGLNAHTAVS